MTTAKQPQENGTEPPAVGSRLDRRVRPLSPKARKLAPLAQIGVCPYYLIVALLRPTRYINTHGLHRRPRRLPG